MSSRRQSLDRPGILSPPGPFLTPSPSPSISAASPRLAPSPSISPFPQDVILVANNTITNTTQEQERKAATPGRRHSINQLNNSGSPNAGTVVFQQSPSQSPAAATTVIGVTGNEFNTTLVGSNNISLNKKGKRSSQTSNFISNYGQTTATSIPVSTSGAVTFTSSSNYMAGIAKGQAKKIGININSNNISNFINQSQNQNQQQQHLLQQQITSQQQFINPSSSPLLADSPISSPSSHQMKPPTPQPQIIQSQLPTVINTSGGNQILQFLQGQQIINATNAIQNLQSQPQQYQSQNFSRQISTSIQNASQGPSLIHHASVQGNSGATKTTKAPQQILPKPITDNNNKILSNSKQQQSVQQQQQLQQSPQISQSPGPQQITTATTPQPQGGQIILPTSNLTGQPLVLNQMPVLVQQNTPQGVQLILRPPTPQLATTPSLVIHNTRPQLQQQPQQQLLRILNTNGSMQLATTPTFIVSSQANLIQQNLQTIKATPAQQSGSTATAMTTALNNLQAAVSNPQQQQQRSQQIAAAINNHIFNQNMAAQLQNLQLNGNLTQIQLPNGIHTATATPMLSQIPQFQQSLAAAGFNQQLQQNINLNHLNTNFQQIAAAAAAAGAAFQSPPPPNINHQTGTPAGSTSASPQLVTDLNQISGANVISASNLQFATQNNSGQQHITIKSPAVTPQPQIIQSITPEPTVLLTSGRNSTPATASVLVQPDHIIQQIQQQQLLAASNAQQRLIQPVDLLRQQPAATKTRKSNKGRKKKSEQIQPMTIAPTIAPLINTTNIAGSTFNNPNNSVILPSPTVQTVSVTTTTYTPTTSSNENSYSSTKRDSSSPPPKSTGKLDLANVMKLCGIMEDDDYMMDDEPIQQIPNQNQSQMQSEEDFMKLNQSNESSNMHQTQSQQHSLSTSSVNNANETSDIMITIPGQSNNDVPFTYTIPTSQCDNSKAGTSINSNVQSNLIQTSAANVTNFDLSGNSIMAQSSNIAANLTVVPSIASQSQQSSNVNGEHVQNVSQNYVIKIDSNDIGGQPYTISIPGLTQNDIQPQLSVVHTQPTMQNMQIVQQPTQSQQVHLQITSSTGSTPTSFSLTSQPAPMQSYMPKSSSFLTAPITSVTNSTMPMTSSTFSSSNPIVTSTGIPSAITITTFANQIQPVPTITSRMTEIQNSLIGVNTQLQQQQQQPLFSQPQIQNQMIPTSSIITSTTVSTISNTIPNSTLNSSTSFISGGNILTTATTTTTTAAIKPRRKPPVKRNNKKSQLVTLPHNSISQNMTTPEIIPAPVCNVPSQIGNIQISQIDATKQQGQSQLPSIATNIVENKIQIMPIIDSTKNTLQSSLNVSSTTNTPSSSSISAVPIQLQQNQQQQQQHQTISNDTIRNTPITSSTAASLITQLTGALSLAFSEDGTRLMLRHDPNLPQDSQSQIILQAVLSGALPNMTIINEPIDKAKQIQPATPVTQKISIPITQQPQIMPQSQSMTAISVQPAKMNVVQQNNNGKSISTEINQMTTTTSIADQQMNQSNPSMQTISNDSLALLQKRPSLEVKKNEIPLTNLTQHQQSTPLVQNINNTQPILPSSSLAVSPKIVALPKIEANQQLFSLNTISNQITQINPNQTTATLGPMERLLIVPAGINAQQLSQCMLQGQIHFDNINPVASDQSGSNQSQNQASIQQQQQQQQQTNLPVGTAIPRIQQQQIVHPLQQSTSKQVANVAPIIDASRATSTTSIAKNDPLKGAAPTISAPLTKRGKPRKQKVDPMKNTALKPIQKLNLTTKPNNSNLVQVVQPTTTIMQPQQQQSQQQAQHSQQQQQINKDQNLPRQIASGPFTSQALSGTGTKLVGVTAPMQQIRTNGMPNNLLTNTNSIPMVMNSANVINSIRTQNSNNPNLSNIMPPLISVNPVQTTVTRVQTIQLTPQQQQLLKNVQMQIQQLSTKLKNTNLLSTLNIPADFDPNNPMYNKPLPSLHNINSMTDPEIHAALQRLFIEQQKILASGKVIPTIQAPSVGGFASLITQSPQQLVQPIPQQTSQQQQQTSSIQLIQNIANANQMQNKHSMSIDINKHSNNINSINQKAGTNLPTSKNEDKSGIPSNIVQPNNHNNIIVNNNNIGNNNNINNSNIINSNNTGTNNNKTINNNIVNNNNANNNSNNNVNNSINNNIAPFNNTNISSNNCSISQRLHVHPSQQNQVLTRPQNQQMFSQQPVVSSPMINNQLQSTQMIVVQQPTQQTIATAAHIQNMSTFQNNTIKNNFQACSQKQQNKNIQLNNKQNSSNFQLSLLPDSGKINSVQQLPQLQQQQTKLLVSNQNQQFNNIEKSQLNCSNLASSDIKIETEELHDYKPPLSEEQLCQSNQQKSQYQLESDNKISAQLTESPKPKIARHALFERQLEVDQLACVKPDYVTPFQSKEEAVKRLIRYHCLYQLDEEAPSDEEYEFEKIASNFNDEFQNLANKYKKLILDESTLPHRTSELCLINRLLVTDIETELLHMRSEASKAYYDFETSPDNFNISPIPIKSDPDLKCDIESALNHDVNEHTKFHLSDPSKSDIKKEPYEYNNSFKMDDDCSTTNSFSQNTNSSSSGSNNETCSNSIKETNFSSNKLHRNTFARESILSEKDDEFRSNHMDSFKNPKDNSVHHKNTELTRNFSSTMHGNNNAYEANLSGFHHKNISKYCDAQSHIKKENLENFDIESEITPSFIMKKVDSKQPPVDLPFSTNTSNNSQAGNKFSSINENKYSSNFDKLNTNQLSDRKNCILNDYKFTHNKFSNSKSNQIINGPSNSKFNNSNEIRFQVNEQHRSTFTHSNDYKFSSNNQNRTFCNDSKFNTIDCKSTSDSVTNINVKVNNKFHPLSEDFNTDDDSNSASNDFSLDFNFDQLKDSKHESDKSKRNEFLNQNNNAAPGRYNEWMTLQKELTLMTEKKSENQHQNLLLHQQMRSTQNMSMNHHMSVSKSVEKQLSEIFDSASPTPKDVDSQLSELFNSTSASTDLLSNGHISSTTSNSKLTSSSHNIQLSELINTEIININHNSIGSKAVETRLDSMFGESPVIEKTDNASDIVESHLNDLFNNTTAQGIPTSNQTTASIHQQSNHLDHFDSQRIDNQNFISSNHLLNNAKRPWTSLDHSDILGESNERNRNGTTTNHHEPTSKRMCIVNSFIEETSTNSSHQNSSRWLIDNQFGDFLSPNAESNQEKHRWNGQNNVNENNILSDSHINKKSNDDIVASWTNHHHESHYNLHETDFPQIEGIAVTSSNHLQHSSNQEHHNLQHNFNSHDSVFGASHSHMNHSVLQNHHSTGNLSGANSSANQSNASITSNFDDDINRHVQNAIDSILNLQNSESDSLNFSLDHSMGSFLADSPLDQHNQQQQSSTHQTQRHVSQQSSNANNLLETSNCMTTKPNRNNRIDDLSDCLISGAVGDNSNIMIHSPIATNVSVVAAVNNSAENGSIDSSTVNNGGNRSVMHNITDFSCVGTGLDEAVKSIMTS